MPLHRVYILHSRVSDAVLSGMPPALAQAAVGVDVDVPWSYHGAFSNITYAAKHTPPASTRTRARTRMRMYYLSLPVYRMVARVPRPPTNYRYIKAGAFTRSCQRSSARPPHEGLHGWARPGRAGRPPLPARPVLARIRRTLMHACTPRVHAMRTPRPAGLF